MTRSSEHVNDHVLGTCLKNQTNECQYRHENPDPKYCSSKLAVSVNGFWEERWLTQQQGLMKISSVFTKLTPLYFQKTMSDDFEKKFLGRSKSG